MEFLKGGDFNKFIVIKVEDVQDYLTEAGKEHLRELLNYIVAMRKQEGKNPNNKYLVVNVDEPYAPEIVELLKSNGHWGARAMKNIIQTTEQVKAILNGTRTAMRTLIKPQPRGAECFGTCTDSTGKGRIGMIGFGNENCVTDYTKPPYRKGDVLYVKETFAIGRISYGEEPDGRAEAYISQCTGEADIIPKEYAMRHDIGIDDVKWRSPATMPREAARIFLLVTRDSWPQRLQDITEEQAIMEGFRAGDQPLGGNSSKAMSAKQAFMWAWQIKHDKGKYPWAANSWLWVTEHERIEKP